MKLLEIRNLRKSFGHNLVLDNVDFEIDSHQVKVLIGASGSGKSTLLRCINLLESIEDGEVFLEGKEITEFGVDKDEVRSNIGSVFQSFNLFPHLTVMQNLILAPTLVHKVSKNDATKRAQELLARFGLSEKAHQYPELLKITKPNNQNCIFYNEQRYDKHFLDALISIYKFYFEII